MKKNLKNYSYCFRENLLTLTTRAVVFFIASASFAMSSETVLSLSTPTIQLQQQKQITGTVKDADGLPIPGVTIVETVSKKIVISDFDGNFVIKTTVANPILTFSYIGYKTQEIKITNQTKLSITMETDLDALDEVVVVGYGTQKKVNLTAAVSVIDSQPFENRPVSNAAQALQGVAPGLQITNSSFGGEPGASPNINIRGFMTSSSDGDIGESSPLILIDGIELDINDIDPEDIESVSVLKDAAAAAIYGSRAAAGAILITTKNGEGMSGEMKVNYSNNFSITQPTIWPESANALNFAYAMNDARANIGSSPWYTDEELGWIQQNLEDPGSAPTLSLRADGVTWDQASVGLGATAATNWKDFLFRDWSSRQKHNLSLRGGNQKLNYYISGGLYNEEGFLVHGHESFNRYNLDAKIGSKPTDWLKFELMTKFRKNDSDFPWDKSYGRGRIFDMLSKIKPTLPTVDPINGEPLLQAYYPLWETNRDESINNQVVIIPKVTIEPIKDWIINMQFNYRRNNNKRIYSSYQYEYTLPDGTSAVSPTQDLTQVNPTLATNEYFSPNIYTNYKKSFNGNNFDLTAGYQHEVYESYNLSASATNLLTDNIPAISTATGEKNVADAITHWSTQGMFVRLNYDYKEKYLASVTYRRDGTSRFEPGDRHVGLPSYTIGYNIAKEDFWPTDEITTFKLRASSGQLGNQNAANYLYVPLIGINTGTYLFSGGEWDNYAVTPDISSINLTWEKVNSINYGLDINAFANRLNFTYEWYRTDVEDMISGGAALPAVLGTSEPRVNAGSIRTQGWETEISWKDKIGSFGYNLKFVLSDYKRTWLYYPNETGTLTSFRSGQDYGEIWGMKWAGWFQTQEEVSEWHDQSAVWGTPGPGDTKYVDVNGDGAITQGSNTVENPGDKSIIGNSTPRYQYSFNIGMNYKGFDLNMFIQGLGKKDVLMSNHQRFRGPAQGPFHAHIFEEHLDYWRDETSPLGANPDAYFPKPYAQNPGRNQRNYRWAVDRYIQDGSYIRLKNIQLGYTFPKKALKKVGLDRLRIFVTGENLLTFSDLMFYDPETIAGNFGSAYSYPLSKVISTGLNLTF